MRILEDMLDRQDEIEMASYDAAVGRQAVAGARRVFASLPIERSGHAQLRAALAALEELRRRQAANQGEYSSGAATVGSIVSDIRRRFRM